MNSVNLVGRLTKDPEVRYTAETQLAVVRFNLAVDRPYSKDQNQTADFISCVAFGKTAEFIEKYFNKGKRIGLQGRIQTGNYEKDGKKVYTTDVVAERVEFVESKSNSGSSDAPSDGDNMQGFTAIDEDDMPF